MSHTCESIAVTCIDFRFQGMIRDWLNDNLTDGKYDYVALAGSTKNLGTIMEQVDISVSLHEVKRVVLMHHEECGAYGAESTPEKHAEDLRKARETVLSKHPDLDVQLYYLHLDGTFESVPSEQPDSPSLQPESSDPWLTVIKNLKWRKK